MGFELLALWTSPLMLGWLAVAAAPLLIHLLSRRRHIEIPWAAVQFLLAAMEKHSRRMRLEQWLLLAVRTAIIVLVVCAVAQPVVQTLGYSTAVGQPSHKLIVVDGSFSMGYRAADASRFERAKALATEIVEQSREGDGFTLVLLGEPPRAVVATPSFASAEVIEEIAALELLDSGGDVPATLKLVEDVLEQARRGSPRLVREEVYFITDLGRSTWRADQDGERGLADFQDTARRLGDETALAVIDVGQADSENLAINRLLVDRPVATVAHELVARATIDNLGRTPRSAVPVELWIDGRQTDRQTVALDGGESVTVDFRVSVDSPGDHVLEARIDADRLDVDNHRWLAMPVKPKVRVLCIDGRPRIGDFAGAAGYVAEALAPAGVDRAWVEPEMATESALVSTDLAAFDCLVLCEVAQFTSQESAVLENYLASGGGLVFFLGEDVRAGSYNRWLRADEPGGRRILPASIGDLVDEPQYTLNPLEYRHPLLSVFRDRERSGLITTPVYRYFRLKPDSDRAAKVALAFDNGDPLVVEESIGRGHVLVVATSAADPAWTSMPVWPSFLPLVQEILQYSLARRDQARNVIVGQPLVLPARAGDARGLTVRTPDEQTHHLRPPAGGAESAWSFDQTVRSGAYSVQAEQGDAEPRLFAANVDTAESDLTKYDEAEFAEAVWPDVQYRLLSDWESAPQVTAAELVPTSSLHRWLLYAALALVACETPLAWLLTKRNS